MSTLLIIILFIVILCIIIKILFSGATNKLKTDMTGKIAIVTGATSGLGYWHARNLLDSGATVIFTYRDEKKAEKVVETIPKEQQSRMECMKLDLCSLQSIRNFAEDVVEKYSEIDILVNNAGAFPTEYAETENKLESILQGNHLGPMFLTLSLVDHIKQNGRIIMLSSIAHKWSQLTEKSVEMLSDLKKVKEFYYGSIAGKYGYLYNDTKLMNIYFASYMNEKFEDRKIPIKICCVHPGACKTDFMRYLDVMGTVGKIISILLQPIYFLFFVSAQKGAQTQIYLSHLDYENLTGGGYYAYCKIADISKKGRNEEIRNAIMRWSIDELKSREEVSFLI